MTEKSDEDIPLVDHAWLKRAIEVVRAHEFAAHGHWPNDSPLPILSRPPANDLERDCLRRLEVRAHVRLSKQASPAEHAGISPHDLARQAVALIQERYANPLLQQGDIAAALRLSPPALSRLLAPITGRTFPQHLHDARTDAAAALLQSAAESITGIGRAVGYSNPGDLSHHFHQRFGITPTAWRAARTRPIGRHILVVDDHEPLRQLYARWIGALGMVCTAVASADEGVAVLNDVHVDVVVTDYDMRPLTGLDLLRAIRKEEHRIALPVGIVTASPELPTSVRSQIKALRGQLLEAFVKAAEFELFLRQLLALNPEANRRGSSI